MCRRFVMEKLIIKTCQIKRLNEKHTEKKVIQKEIVNRSDFFVVCGKHHEKKRPKEEERETEKRSERKIKEVSIEAM